MTKICKEYIKEIKAIFPIKGKSEKKYLKELLTNIEDFAEEENVTDKNELYQNFGKPIEIVAEYFANIETEYIVKKIKFSKFIKLFIVVIITILLAISTMFCVFKIQHQQMALRETEVISCEEETEVLDRGEIEEATQKETNQTSQEETKTLVQEEN